MEIANNSLEQHLALMEHATELAHLKLLGSSLPHIYEIDTDDFAVLGKKFNVAASKVKDRLTTTHGGELPCLIGISVRKIWLAVWEGAFFFRLSIEDGTILDNDYTQRLTTPEGYGQLEGWAYSLYNDLCRNNRHLTYQSFRIGTPFNDESTVDTLACAALYFYSLAAKSLRENEIEKALDWLYEAADAENLIGGENMWQGGLETGKQDASMTARSELARHAAASAHRENRAMKATALEWCDAKRREFKSKDDAAAELIKVVPIKFRTAYSWIVQWEKLRSAS